MIVCTQCGNWIRKCQCEGQPEVMDTRVSKASRLLCRALRQYRHNHDNSPDLLKPEHGFTHGYDKDIADEIVDGLIDERDRYRALLVDIYHDKWTAPDLMERIERVLGTERPWHDTALEGKTND